MRKSLGWVFGLLLGLLLLAAVILATSAGLSMDRSFQYSRNAGLLPVYPETDSHELTRVRLGEASYRARAGGLENQGPALILLHGFPETSAMWTPLMAAAVSQGYRVVAFDQRGYSPGARPDHIVDYTISNLVQDVLDVADAVGFETFHLVGHDWGSAVGWGVVMAHPDRVLSWSSLSIPHPAAFGEALQNDPEQKKRSAYMLLFQQPWLPEQLFAFNDQMLLREVFYNSMPEWQRREYLSLFSEPGAMTAALNWYRGLNLAEQRLPGQPEIEQPVLFIWGNADPAVSSYSIQAQRKYLLGPYKEIELDAGHWLMEEKTSAVVTAVLKQLNTTTYSAHR